jgi:hypothetical protein
MIIESFDQEESSNSGVYHCSSGSDVAAKYVHCDFGVTKI